MLRRLAPCLAITALTTFSSAPASGAPGSITTFETVDAIEGFFAPDTSRAVGVKVTGILVGSSAPTTVQVRLTNFTIAGASGVGAVDPVARCDRMAMLAMSKPGKFQFALVETDVPVSTPVFTCKLIVRAP